MTINLPLPWTFDSLWLLVQIGVQLTVPVLIVTAILMIIGVVISEAAS